MTSHSLSETLSPEELDQVAYQVILAGLRQRLRAMQGASDTAQEGVVALIDAQAEPAKKRE